MGIITRWTWRFSWTRHSGSVDTRTCADHDRSCAA